MTTYRALTEKAGEALNAAATNITASQDPDLLHVVRGQHAAGATWALASAQVAATLAIAEALTDLTTAVRHLEGTMQA